MDKSKVPYTIEAIIGSILAFFDNKCFTRHSNYQLYFNT